MMKLATIDVGFLLTESHHSPKHVAGLQIFRLPKGKGTAWLRKLLDEMRKVPPGYPFNQRLKKDVIQPELEFDDHHVLCDGVTFARWFAESGSQSATDMNSRPIWQRDEIPVADDDKV